MQFKNIEWSTGSSGSWQAVPQPRSGVPEGTVSGSGIACGGHSQEMLNCGEYKLWRNKVVKMIHMLCPSWGMPTTMFPFVVVSPCALPYVRTWLPPSADRTFLSRSTYLGTIFHTRWKMLQQTAQMGREVGKKHTKLLIKKRQRCTVERQETLAQRTRQVQRQISRQVSSKRTENNTTGKRKPGECAFITDQVAELIHISTRLPGRIWMLLIHWSVTTQSWWPNLKGDASHTTYIPGERLRLINTFYRQWLAIKLNSVSRHTSTDLPRQPSSVNRKLNWCKQRLTKFWQKVWLLGAIMKQASLSLLSSYEKRKMVPREWFWTLKS